MEKWKDVLKYSGSMPTDITKLQCNLQGGWWIFKSVAMNLEAQYKHQDN